MRFLCLFAATALVGCAIVDDDTSTSTSNLIAHNRLAANRLAANRLAANRLAANRLAANRITSTSLSLSDGANDLLATADGREVLTYLISCALPSGTTLVAADSSTFDGEIGVAPQWLNENLDEEGQRWISACVFARVSDLDVAIPISMRGPNPALVVDPSEQTDWSLQQGAFYGLLFTGANASGPEWLACSGADVVAAESVNRICASPDPANPGFTKCGFVYTGVCGGDDDDDHHGHGHGHHWGWGHEHHEHHEGACERFNDQGTYFEDCSGWTGGHDIGPNWHGVESHEFDEVVTVYAHP